MAMNTTIDQALSQAESMLLKQNVIAFEKELELEMTKAIAQIQTGEGIEVYATQEEFEVMLHRRLRAHTTKISE
jgi:hypothetical protein